MFKTTFKAILEILEGWMGTRAWGCITWCYQCRQSCCKSDFFFLCPSAHLMSASLFNVSTDSWDRVSAVNASLSLPPPHPLREILSLRLTSRPSHPRWWSAILIDSVTFDIRLACIGYLLTKINIGKTGNQKTPSGGGGGGLVTCISNIDFFKAGNQRIMQKRWIS